LAILLEDLDASTRLPLAAAGLALLFFDQRHRLEANRLLRDITERCNERYQSEWSALQQAVQGKATDEQQRETFTKYLNLCAEEYLYWSLGLLHPHVWRSWVEGMRSTFASSQALLGFAREELGDGSYYGFRLAVLGLDGNSPPP
jgi:hypothetical protein